MDLSLVLSKMKKELTIIAIYPQGDRIVTEYSDGTKTDVHKNDYEVGKPESQVFEFEVTQETLDLNPELVDEVEVGDKIEIPLYPEALKFEEAEKLLATGYLLKEDGSENIYFCLIKTGECYQIKNGEIESVKEFTQAQKENYWSVVEPTEELAELLDQFHDKLSEEPKPEEGKKSKKTTTKKQK